VKSGKQGKPFSQPTALTLTLSQRERGPCDPNLQKSRLGVILLGVQVVPSGGSWPPTSPKVKSYRPHWQFLLFPVSSRFALTKRGLQP